MYDYNPGMIAEFQQWLQNQYGSITALDTQFNLNFANWTSVDPPRIYQPGNPWFEAWTNFRTYIVQQNVNAEAQWIAEEGIPLVKSILTKYSRYLEIPPRSIFVVIHYKQLI